MLRMMVASADHSIGSGGSRDRKLRTHSRLRIECGDDEFGEGKKEQEKQQKLVNVQLVLIFRIYRVNKSSID